MGHNPAKYSADKVIAMADTATRQERPAPAVLAKGLKDTESGVRMWAATGLLISGASAVKAHSKDLEACLADASPSVRIAAGEALARYGDDAVSSKAIDTLIELANLNKHGFYTALQSLNALEEVGVKLKGREQALKALPTEHDSVNSRMREDIGKALDKVLSNLS
jgi:HEAT repeat protein